MKKNLFKAIACAVFILFPLSSFAQNESAAKTLRPEFTARLNLGLYNSGAVLSGGVRLDDKHTVGLMVSGMMGRPVAMGTSSLTARGFRLQ